MKSSGPNPFIKGFTAGLFTGLALSIVVALLVTHNSPYTAKSTNSGADGASKIASPVDAPRLEQEQAASGVIQDTKPAAPASALGANTRYFLQVGAFTKAEDADALKARLALMGLEANIISSSETDKPLHKVQIGPLKSMDELNTIRARLTKNGLDSMLIRNAP